ncbi:unnamed protein product [Lupinus luteus]|uniref:Uncharacterized protein n=1 Tax=Lupinus luteus TaxID=3873 RepID=A0AAV1WK10_LUPLU
MLALSELDFIFTLIENSQVLTIIQKRAICYQILSQFIENGKLVIYDIIGKPQRKAKVGVVAVSMLQFLTIVEQASSLQLLQLHEPDNALFLPTWVVHVSSVLEWILAVTLVWQYGDKSGYEAWKGLSWVMVPLLGGALSACTWHFFYNSESLEAALPALPMAIQCPQKLGRTWTCLFLNRA